MDTLEGMGKWSEKTGPKKHHGYLLTRPFWLTGFFAFEGYIFIRRNTVLNFYSFLLWLSKFQGPSEKSNDNMVTLPETNEFSHLKMDGFFDTICLRGTYSNGGLENVP